MTTKIIERIGNINNKYSELFKDIEKLVKVIKEKLLIFINYCNILLNTKYFRINLAIMLLILVAQLLIPNSIIKNYTYHDYANFVQIFLTIYLTLLLSAGYALMSGEFSNQPILKTIISNQVLSIRILFLYCLILTTIAFLPNILIYKYSLKEWLVSIVVVSILNMLYIFYKTYRWLSDEYEIDFKSDRYLNNLYDIESLKSYKLKIILDYLKNNNVDQVWFNWLNIDMHLQFKIILTNIFIDNLCNNYIAYTRSTLVQYKNLCFDKNFAVYTIHNYDKLVELYMKLCYEVSVNTEYDKEQLYVIKREILNILKIHTEVIITSGMYLSKIINNKYLEYYKKLEYREDELINYTIITLIKEYDSISKLSIKHEIIKNSDWQVIAFNLKNTSNIERILYDNFNMVIEDYIDGKNQDVVKFFDIFVFGFNNKMLFDICVFLRLVSDNFSASEPLCMDYMSFFMDFSNIQHISINNSMHSTAPHNSAGTTVKVKYAQLSHEYLNTINYFINYPKFNEICTKENISIIRTKFDKWLTDNNLEIESIDGLKVLDATLNSIEVISRFLLIKKFIHDNPKQFCINVELSL